MIKWANGIGKNGIDYEEYLKNSANIGLLTHLLIGDYINKKDTDSAVLKTYKKEQIELANIYFNSFKKWYETEEISPIVSEFSMVSKTLGFGGTCDFVFGDKDNKVVLVDFKTTTHIQKDYFIQMMAYSLLLKEKDIKVNKIAVLRFFPDGHVYKEMDVAEAKNRYYEYFMTCKNLFKAKKELEKWE